MTNILNPDNYGFSDRVSKVTPDTCGSISVTIPGDAIVDHSYPGHNFHINPSCFWNPNQNNIPIGHFFNNGNGVSVNEKVLYVTICNPDHPFYCSVNGDLAVHKRSTEGGNT